LRKNGTPDSTNQRVQDTLEIQLSTLLEEDVVENLLLADVPPWPSTSRVVGRALATLPAIHLQFTLQGRRLTSSLSSILKQLQSPR
jgi:hypothetical protein